MCRSALLHLWLSFLLSWQAEHLAIVPETMTWTGQNYDIVSGLAALFLFPFSRSLDRPLQLIMHMPYALIVPLCVAPALIGHLVVLRTLLRRTENSS